MTENETHTATLTTWKPGNLSTKTSIKFAGTAAKINAEIDRWDTLGYNVEVK